MKTFASRLKISSDLFASPENAVEWMVDKDGAHYENVCLFCANNDISIKELTSKQFDQAVNKLAKYCYENNGKNIKIWWWIEK